MVIKNKLNSAGIYKLTCRINNKIYIGKAVNIGKRLNRHKNCAQRNEHRYYLQYAIIKHGWKSFDVDILEIIDNFDKNNNDHKQLLLDKEAYYIALFDSTNKDIGYNICKYSTDSTGIIMSEETKEKIRLSRIGAVFSEQHRKNISISRRGKKATDEAKKNMSLSKKGKPISEEIRKKRFGRTLSDETKAKIGLASRGRKLSEETKEKIRLSARGRKLSEETKEKLRIINSGKKLSEETKEKIRISHIGKKQSDATLEKKRNSMMGKMHSQETKEKISKSKKGIKRNMFEEKSKDAIQKSETDMSILEKLAS